jgi:hypothetical protein
MQEAKRRIPHFMYAEEIDATELEALRLHLNASKKPDQPKLTLLPFFVAPWSRSCPSTRRSTRSTTTRRASCTATPPSTAASPPRRPTA